MAATRFQATALVVDNQSAVPIFVAAGRKPNVNTNYDYRVPPGAVLAVHTTPTATFWIVSGGPAFGSAEQTALPGTVDLYLLAGSYAAFIPPYTLTPRPGYAMTALGGFDISSTGPTDQSVTWNGYGGTTHFGFETNPAVDPFCGWPVLLDRITCTGPGTPGDHQVLTIPLPNGLYLAVPVPMPFGVVDLGGVMVGRWTRTPGKGNGSTYFDNAPTNGHYDFEFIYRLIGPANDPSTTQPTTD